MRVVAGVDCHKSSHTAVFLDAVGQLVERITFPTTEEGYERALAVGRRLDCADWGLEGAGCYGYAFSVFARAEAPECWRFPVSSRNDIDAMAATAASLTRRTRGRSPR
jgi:hypothetical protein